MLKCFIYRIYAYLHIDNCFLISYCIGSPADYEFSADQKIILVRFCHENYWYDFKQSCHLELLGHGIPLWNNKLSIPCLWMCFWPTKGNIYIYSFIRICSLHKTQTKKRYPFFDWWSFLLFATLQNWEKKYCINVNETLVFQKQKHLFKM